MGTDLSCLAWRLPYKHTWRGCQGVAKWLMELIQRNEPAVSDLWSPLIWNSIALTEISSCFDKGSRETTTLIYYEQQSHQHCFLNIITPTENVFPWAISFPILSPLWSSPARCAAPAWRSPPLWSSVWAARSRPRPCCACPPRSPARCASAPTHLWPPEIRRARDSNRQQWRGYVRSL